MDVDPKWESIETINKNKLMSQYKEIEPRKIRSFILGEEPELLHIFQLGYKDLYAVFYEDAYEMEPWQSGIKTYTSKEIEEKFKIKL